MPIDDKVPDDLTAMAGGAAAAGGGAGGGAADGGNTAGGGVPADSNEPPSPGRPAWLWAVIAVAVIAVVAAAVVLAQRSSGTKNAGPSSAATQSATPSGTAEAGPSRSAEPSASASPAPAGPTVTCGSSNAASDLVTVSNGDTVTTMKLAPTSTRGAWVMFSCINEDATAVTFRNPDQSDPAGTFYVVAVKDRTLTSPSEEFETTPASRQAIAGSSITVQPGQQFAVVLIADKAAQPEGLARVYSNAELTWESAPDETILLQIPWGANVEVPQ